LGTKITKIFSSCKKKRISWQFSFWSKRKSIRKIFSWKTTWKVWKL